MAIFETHNMLRAFRRGGYNTIRTTDSEGNRVWEIRRPEWRYNCDNDVNEPSNTYVGKVVSIGPRVNLGLFDLCFGKPFFYSRNENDPFYHMPAVQDARLIAARTRRGSVRCLQL